MGASLAPESRSFIVKTLLGDEPMTGNPVATFTAEVAKVQDLLLSDDHYDFVSATLGPLLNNTLDTHNVELLLHFAWSTLDHAVCNRAGNDATLCGALRACHNIVRLAVEAADGDAVMLLKYLDTDGVASKLVMLLVEFIVNVPLDATSSRAHGEVLLLLLTFCSTALHHSPEYEPERKDMYIELILSSDVIEPLCVILAQRFVAWGNNLLPTSQYFYVGGAQPSLFNLYYLFGTLNKDKRVDIAQMLGHLSVQALLAISFYQRGTLAENTAFNALVRLADSEHISFQLLLAAVRAKLPGFPEVLMLLYPLIHQHPTFLPAAFRSHPDELKECLNGLLFHLSEGRTEATQHMAATDLLILSQDAELVSALFSWQTNVSWFTARKNMPKYIGKCAVGSLAVVCLAKTLARTLFSSKPNHSLGSVCLGVLANMAPFVHDIEPYPAQRIIAVFCNMVRRASTLHRDLQKTPDAYSTQAELRAVVDAAATLSEILFVAVSGHAADKQNFPLLYEILYNRERLVVDEARQHPDIVAALQPLLHLASFYETELASVSQSHTSEEIIGIIKRVSQDDAMIEVVASGSGSSGGGATTSAAAAAASRFTDIKHQYEDLFFSYEEAANSYVFFGPFLWQQVANQSKDRPSSTFKWVADGATPKLLQAYVSVAARRVSQSSTLDLSPMGGSIRESDTVAINLGHS